jgi:cation diffusion facilitator CzcD-associated flavoprotein CzcO
VFHTAQWRSDVNLRGARVAVIGSGCSAAQVVPAIQPEVATLDVYQRTPGWTMPRGDFAYSERSKRLFRRWPAVQRLDRKLVQGFMEVGAIGMTRQQWMLAPFKAIGRRRINKAIQDPALRAAVTPKDQYGCKRVMVVPDPGQAGCSVDLRRGRARHPDRRHRRRRSRAPR